MAILAHQETFKTGPTGVVHRGTGPTPRSTRTPEQVESNRAFMAAAGRVAFGRYEATQRGVWIAFAYFASLGAERICYAAVERSKDDDVDRPAGGGIAERAKVSGRTVRRHIPALIARGLIGSENRAGGRTPTSWKVTIPDELIAPVRTLRPARPDRVSDDISNRTYVPGRAAKPQARPGGNEVDCGGRPVTTAAPLKGLPVPLHSPPRLNKQEQPVVLATPAEATPHVEAMRIIAQQATAERTPTVTTDHDLTHGQQLPISDEQEALFKEQDRELQQLREAKRPTPRRSPCCPQCGHNRIIGGSCHECGYDDGTGPQPSADYNIGH